MSFDYSQAMSTRVTRPFRLNLHEFASLLMQYQSCCLKLPVRIRKKRLKSASVSHMESYTGTLNFLHQKNRKRNCRESVSLTKVRLFFLKRPFVNKKRNGDISLQEGCESPITFEGYNFVCLRALKMKES